MSNFAYDVKLNISSNFYKKINNRTHEEIQSELLDGATEFCFTYISKGGIGYKSPKGGAPISQEGDDKATYYSGFLRDSHYKDTSSKNVKYIKAYADYWQDVVKGRRPIINPTTGHQYAYWVHNYIPNPYNKRAADNLISSGILQKRLTTVTGKWFK